MEFPRFHNDYVQIISIHSQNNYFSMENYKYLSEHKNR